MKGYFLKFLSVCLLLSFFSLPVWASAEGAVTIPFKELFFKIINLSLFIGIICFFAGKTIKEMFAARREEIDRQIHEAGNALETAHKEETALKEELANFKQREERLLSEAKDNADSEKKKIIERARQLAQTIRQAGEKSAITEKIRIDNQLLYQSVEQAIAGLTADFSKKGIAGPEKEEYISKFVKEVERRG